MATRGRGRREYGVTRRSDAESDSKEIVAYKAVKERCRSGYVLKRDMLHRTS